MSQETSENSTDKGWASLYTELAQQRQRVRDLEAERDELRVECHTLKKNIAEMSAAWHRENEELREFKQDMIETHRKIVAEQCAPDEVHCSCVPSLRGEIELLRDQVHQAGTKLERAENALQKIAKWFDEFPATGQAWPSGEPMSYGACYGSNGERDYMRKVAQNALTALDEKK